MCGGGIVGYRKFEDGENKGGGRGRGTWKRRIGRRRTIASRGEGERFHLALRN